MTTRALKKKLHHFIDESDNKILKVVHVILEEHSRLKSKNESGLSEEDIEELDLRWDEYKKGKAKTFSLNDTLTDVNKKLKSIKR